MKKIKNLTIALPLLLSSGCAHLNQERINLNYRERPQLAEYNPNQEIEPDKSPFINWAKDVVCLPLVIGNESIGSLTSLYPLDFAPIYSKKTTERIKGNREQTKRYFQQKIFGDCFLP